MPKTEMRNKARNLRLNQTPAERLLWSKLRSRQLSGTKFRRQQPIDNYILDFYCSEARLAIEIDGGQHADDENQRKDSLRTAAFEEQGIRVIRFWNDDILKHLDEALAEIDATLKEIVTNDD